MYNLQYNKIEKFYLSQINLFTQTSFIDRQLCAVIAGNVETAERKANLSQQSLY